MILTDWAQRVGLEVLWHWKPKIWIARKDESNQNDIMPSWVWYGKGTTPTAALQDAFDNHPDLQEPQPWQQTVTS